MPVQSAGVLLFRRTAGATEFLLAHPGGPFWAKKDEGAWSIPKGVYQEPESAVDAARRELQEEIGLAITGDLLELGKFKQPSGKVVSVWAAERDFDVGELRSNLFSMEWPPKSGRRMEFPEVDRAGWFSFTEAATKITKGQLPILMKLAAELGIGGDADAHPQRRARGGGGEPRRTRRA
jgi:predicted NUDIX family NTP pyrophosphohydrolase